MRLYRDTGVDQRRLHQPRVSRVAGRDHHALSRAFLRETERADHHCQARQG